MKQVFVIQHPNLAALPLVQTARHFRLPESITGSSLRLAVAADAAIPAEVAAELDAAGAEYALLADTAFADLGLIVSDMDSTLITIECIDEIAAAAGLKEKVSAVTERAMRGEMDFEDSLRERVALLAGLPESVLDDVYEHALRLSPGAEYLLAECKKHQVKFLLVSGGFTFFTERLKERLGLDWAYANTLETAGGKLTGRVVGRSKAASGCRRRRRCQRHPDAAGRRFRHRLPRQTQNPRPSRAQHPPHGARSPARLVCLSFQAA